MYLVLLCVRHVFCAPKAPSAATTWGRMQSTLIWAASQHPFGSKQWVGSAASIWVQAMGGQRGARSGHAQCRDRNPPTNHRPGHLQAVQEELSVGVAGVPVRDDPPKEGECRLDNLTIGAVIHKDAQGGRCYLHQQGLQAQMCVCGGGRGASTRLKRLAHLPHMPIQ